MEADEFDARDLVPLDEAFHRRGMCLGQRALDLGHRTFAAERPAQRLAKFALIGHRQPRPGRDFILAVALDESDIDTVERGAAHQADRAIKLLRHVPIEPQSAVARNIKFPLGAMRALWFIIRPMSENGSENGGHYPIERREGEIERLHRQGAAMAPDCAIMLEKIGVTEGWRCLDLGCGPRGITPLLSARVGASGKVTGLDADPVFVDYGRRNAAANTDFVQGDAYSAALPAGIVP